MKKTHFLISSIFVLTFVFGGEIVKSIEFPTALLSLKTKDGYTVVNYGNAPEIDGRPGSPALPVVPIQVLLPPTAFLTAVEILEMDEVKIPGRHLVYPIQEAETWSRNKKENVFIPPAPDFYNLEQLYPEKIVNYLQTGNRGGFRIGSFLLFPCRYLPKSKELYFIKRLKLKVLYQENKFKVSEKSALKIKIFGEDVSEMVINPEDVKRFSPSLALRKRFSPHLPPGYYEYIIITPAMFADSLQPLLLWRKKQGYPSNLVTIEYIQNTYPGRDLAEKMRNFIIDAESTWHSLFFFIVRKDHPERQYRRLRVFYSATYRDTLPGDIYFADLDGDWDFNRNNIFGEVADSIDGYHDVFVGMITADAVDEVSRYLKKVFRYEKTPDSLYITKNLLTCGVDFSYNYNDSIANASPAHWFNCKMYMVGGGVTPTPARFSDSLNSGYGYTSVIAHGDVTIMDLGGYVTGRMMHGLTNVNKLNILIAVCCYPGAFDIGDNCLAETMATIAPNGFVGVIMNSRYGWIRVAEYYNYHFFYKFLPRMPLGRHPLCSAYVHIGQALAYAKDQLRPLWPMTDSSRWRWESYERNLFGDPIILLFNDRISRVSADFPGVIPIGHNIPVTVTVRASGVPVESAMVCLFQDEDVYAKGKTNREGTATLFVSPSRPGFIYLTISGRNFYPYEDTIVVISPGRYVSYLRHFIDDAPPRGNGDGIPNPGEELEVPLWVKNWGNLPASGVIGKFFTRNPQAQSFDTIKNFGVVPANDSAYTGPDGYNLRINTGLPNGYPVLCSLICKDADDSTWISRLTITVGTPVFNYQTAIVSDSHARMPNGRIDPNEEVFLSIGLKNIGMGHGYNVSAVLYSYDTLLVVRDSIGNYGFVHKDSVRFNCEDRFTVFADPRIRPETEVPCTLFVLAEGGYREKIGFKIGVGILTITDPIPDNEPALARYWAYDDIDTFYLQRPAFEWVEIRNVGVRLPITLDDQTIRIRLPFVFKYYGIRYTDSLSVCGNGWISPIRTTSAVYINQRLPDPTTGNPSAMICPNWDDLYPPTGNGIWYFHDTLNRRLILEWDSVHYFNPREQWDKFQVIIYDTTHPSPTGDNIIIFQYLTANHYVSNTVGFEDQTNTRGINVVFNTSYHRAAAPLVSRRVIKFITGDPLVGDNEDEVTFNKVKHHHLIISPSIVRNQFRIACHLKEKGFLKITLYDVTGRLVRNLYAKRELPGIHNLEFANLKLPRGVYILRVEAGSKESYHKIILIP